MIRQLNRNVRLLPCVLGPLLVLLVNMTVNMTVNTTAWSEIDREAARQSGAEALRESAPYPWYDADQDQVKPIEVSKPAAPPQARNWEFDGSWFDWDWNGGALIGNGIWDVLQFFAYVLIVIALLFLIYHVLKFMGLLSPRDDDSGDLEEANALSNTQRIENLPFPVVNSKTDLLAEARRLYQIGKYDEAIVYLFSYQLVKLDETQYIRLSRGKTNRQYLGELRERHGLRSMVSRTMIAFEDVFFGHHPLGKDRFESCWSQLDEFHRMVQMPNS